MHYRYAPIINALHATGDYIRHLALYLPQIITLAILFPVIAGKEWHQTMICGVYP